MHKFYWVFMFAVFTSEFCIAQRYDRYYKSESFYTSAGIEAGLNVGGMNTNPGGLVLISRSTVAEPRVGFILDQPLTRTVYFQPGVFWETVGTALSMTDASATPPISEKEVWSLSYIHFPVNLVAKLDLGSGKILFGLGAYYNVAQKAGIKLSGSQGASHYDSSYEPHFGSGQGELAKYESGIVLSTGYEMSNGIFFRVGTDLGLSSVGKYQYFTEKNWCLHISAGYIVRRGRDRDVKRRPAKPIPRPIVPKKIDSKDQNSNNEIKPLPAKPIDVPAVPKKTETNDENHPKEVKPPKQ